MVTGRADVILDMVDGRADQLAILDYKVAHDTLREERYRLQLAVYTAAGRDEGLTVDAAYIHELRDGARVSVDVGEQAVDAANTRVEHLLRVTRAGHFEANPGPVRCTACEYRRICKDSADRQ